MPAEKPTSKIPPDRTYSPENSASLGQNGNSVGKPLFREEASAHEGQDTFQAVTARKLKKNFQRVRRRKQWLKIAGIFGFLIILLSGIGVGLWEKNKLFRVTMLKAVSPVVSIHIPPQMVTVPAGNFRQGHIHSEEFPGEHPLRKVTVKPFAIGKFEVTFEEYDRFAIATGRSLPRDEGWGRGRRPVINISWEDAVDYAEWLSQETGSRYRLPSESEWEYAARNKGNDHVWAGTSDTARLEDYAWYNSNSGGKTQPVGGKSPNGLGIHDMSGNVWEWVNDCWHDTYTDAPTDGSAWLERDGGNCDVRLRRGGGWKDSPDALRTSFRNGYSSDTRSTLIGFRLVQELGK